MQAEPPNYLTRVTVKNTRCFEHVELDLSDGQGGTAMWTVLLGENGRGKTTMLQAIAALSQSTVAEGSINPLSQRSSHRRPGPAEVLAHLLDGRHCTVHFGAAGAAYHWEPTVPFFAYGATRRSSSAVLASDPENGSSLATLYDPEARLINAEEWLLRLDYAARASKDTQRAEARLAAVRSLLIDLLPDVSEIEVLPPEDDEGGRVRFHTPFGAVGLMDLGLGYQAMIAWMADLAARLFRHYRNSSRPTAEPCIVLVDEIDLHLHPTWQRHLQVHLLEQFPAAQFIVTAHSPLMVQTAFDQNLAVLLQDGDAVRIDNNPRVVQGWRVDQLLTSELFELPSARPPAVAALLAERTELVGQGELDGPSQKRLADIDAQLGRLPTADSVQAQDDLDALKALARRLAEELDSA